VFNYTHHSLILYTDVVEHTVSIEDYMFNVFAFCNPYNIYIWYNNIILQVRLIFLQN
jgi:hypothetical protein